eukprot:TRINITY_DN42234_c0_g1_i1.p2 TRINITY_DN42234_c0_g1~~TRINITY_DN42234_c0_g1_i1.p2  ORF type:complete len:445 (+),score=-69.91 TRINITY_DN42234_c0_g1_i1:138-1472(+)
MQSTETETWFLENNAIKQVHFDYDKGFGLRAVQQEFVGFAFSNNLTRAALVRAANSVKSSLHVGSVQQRINLSTPRVMNASTLYPHKNPLQSLTEREKTDWLLRLNKQARALDARVREVFISLSGQFEAVLIATNTGEMQTDIRPLVHISVTVIAESAGRKEKGRSGGGGRWAHYTQLQDLGSDYVEKAVKQALVNLEAREAPAGVMPVVLGAGWPAVLLHEAVGHGLEGDFNRKGSSAFSQRLGEKVAPITCTIVDDGTLSARRGSLNIDDEGTVTQYTPLIERGVLKNYMQDKQNAALMGMSCTGNGRRESYAYPPLPRMTNTYLLPGELAPEEIIASVSRGLYVVDISGGQVDITSGKFVFSTSEAYLIENGRVTLPVRGATLIGDGPEVLGRVSLVGNDLALDAGIGTCGKAGQSVPVGVGQPTVCIEALTVGGVDTEVM